MTMKDAGLLIRDLSVKYASKTVVKSLSLGPIPHGQVLALLGPNAAGKSTVLRGIAGVGKASGQVFLDGREVSALSRAARAKIISYMPQSQPPAIGLPVLEAVMAANSAAAGRQAALREAYNALESLEVAHLAMQPLSALSGGQRQMVALTQAVVRQPEVLLLDEPTSALDLKHQIRVMECARTMARERGTIVIAVLHDISLALRYADSIAVLKSGAIHSHGSPEDVITQSMLAEIYGINARIEHCTRGNMQLIIDGTLAS